MQQVAAAVIVENGRLLLVRRGPDETLSGKWELPGGKLEEGESPHEALERELHEELDMKCRPGEIVARTSYRYDHGAFEMLAIATTRESDFELTVHDTHVWAVPADLAQLEIAPADVELLEQIRDEGRWRIGTEYAPPAEESTPGRDLAEMADDE